MAVTNVAGGKGKVSGKGKGKGKGKPKPSEGPKGTAGVFGAGSTKEMLAEGKPLASVPVPRHLQGKVAAKAERDGGSKYGLRTALRMTHFADAVLIANATAHRTDADLQATLASEFPKRQSKGSGVQGVPTIQAISAYRAYFNAGKHGHNTQHGTDDGRKLAESVSYNANGLPRGSESPAPKGKGKGKAGK